MLSSTNFWMCVAGLIYLAVGVFVIRKEISAARGWEKLISLGCVFFAVPLAVFAPEHFRGPEFVKESVPSWMPVRWFWPYFVGCALVNGDDEEHRQNACSDRRCCQHFSSHSRRLFQQPHVAATSLTLRKFVRLSSTLLALMFSLFVCMIYVPSALENPTERFAWSLLLRDLSFAAGAWSLAGLYSRASSPQQSKWMILFGRIAIAIAAIFFGVEHFLHPNSAPGIPLPMMTPTWVPFPSLWAYLAGAILLAAGIALALNKKPRIAATSIGALMTALTVFLYLPILILARGESEVIVGLNYVADTLLYAGAALLLAGALPRDPDRSEKM